MASVFAALGLVCTWRCFGNGMGLSSSGPPKTNVAMADGQLGSLMWRVVCRPLASTRLLSPTEPKPPVYLDEWAKQCVEKEPNYHQIAQLLSPMAPATPTAVSRHYADGFDEA